MIQRIQSLWLLLASVSAFLSFKLPFFSGTKEGVKNIPETAIIDGGSNLFLLVATGAALIISLMIIFLYYNEIKSLAGSISLSCIFVFLIPVAFIMAARSIWHDEKLVKSLNK